MKKNDLILICSALITALLIGIVFILISNKSSDTAVVTLNGEEYARLPLNEDTELTINTPNGTNKLVIKDGKAYMSEASCPDLVCVKSGELNELEPIVCLPNGVVVSLEEASD